LKSLNSAILKHLCDEKDRVWLEKWMGLGSAVVLLFVGYKLPFPWNLAGWILASVCMILQIVVLVLTRNNSLPAKKRSLESLKKCIAKSDKKKDFTRILALREGMGDWISDNFPDWDFVSQFARETGWDECFLDEFSSSVWRLRITREKAALRVNGEATSSGNGNQVLDFTTNLLRKYNHTWKSERLILRNTPPGYAKGISNPAAEPIIRKALEHPWLYRLNFIKQLGTVCLHRNLDASHHRLAHAIGTAESAALVYESLVRKLTNNPIESIDDNQDQRQAVILFALAHDCGQGPFGHSLEPLRDVLGDMLQIRLDKEIMLRHLEGHGPLRSFIQHAVGPENADDVATLMTFLIDRGIESRERDDLWFLAEIVDSVVDADRFDYLVRDALHLGLPKYEKNRWIDVLMAARVVTVNAGGKSRRRIAFPITYRDRIEEFVNLRRQFYARYYESIEKLCADEMLCHIIYYHFKEIGLLEAFERYPQEKRNIISEFMQLTDENLFPFLSDLRASAGQGSLRIAADMIDDLLTGRHFQEVGKSSITLEEVDKAAEDKAEAMDCVKQARLKEEDSPRKGDNSPEAHQRRVKRIQQIFEEKSIGFTARLLYFVEMITKSFDKKVMVHREPPGIG
jgi:HD superfamily phosphohydrolase